MPTEKTPYHRTFRRTLLDMHVPDWDPEFLSQYEPEKVADLYAKANITGALFYCKSHMGLNYWPVPVGAVHPAAQGRDFVGEMMAALRARGIAPAAYHTVIFDNWAVEHNPEWAIVPATTLKGYDSHLFGPRYGTACANKPAYRAYEKAQITALLERYDFDALWIDMVFWTGLCVCPDCRARFRAEDGEDVPLSVDWASPSWARYQAARERWLEELTVELIEAAHKARPGIAVTHNLAPGTHGWFTAQKLQWSRHDTFVAGDLYGGRDEQLVISKLMVHLGQEQPAEFMTSRCVNLRNHTALKSEHEMLTAALATTAHSCAFLFIDAVDPRGTVNPGVYDRIGRVYSETARYEPFLGGTPVEDAAVYYSDESRVFPADDGLALADILHHPQGLPHLHAVTGAVTRLQAAHIPFGVITRNNLAELSRYRLVVLPDLLRTDDEELAAFRDYVAGGGHLYASGGTSVVSTAGEARPDFGLADVFGAHLADVEHGSGIYLRARSEMLAAAMSPEDCFGFGFPAHDEGGNPRGALAVPRLAPAPDADVLATLNLPYGYPSPGSRDARDFASIHASPPWQDVDNPTITTHKFGAGRCTYSVVPVEVDGTEAGRRIFASLVADLLDEPTSIRSDAAPAVWLTLFDQPEHNRVVVSALWYDADTRPAPFPLSFTYRPPAGRHVTSATEAVTGKDIALRTGGDGEVTVDVGAVDLFGMYLLHY